MEIQPKGGPKTEEGKAVSRYNAIKHGLLSKEVLIEGEEAEDLTKLKTSIYEALEPVGSIEELLVDRIISNVWRLRRALVVERNTMEWYENYNNFYSLDESKAQQKRKQTRDILCNDNIEKILRYETTIERSLFRSIHELERFQAKRNGEDVSIPTMVDLTLDSSFGKNNPL